MAQNVQEPVTDKAYEYLSLVRECQQGNGGVCTMAKYVDILLSKGKLPRSFEINPPELRSDIHIINEERERVLDGSGWI